jgi:hypothetical protein
MPGAAAPSPIADKLRIPNALPSNIPAGHVAVTFPIRSEDADMIASISMTLQNAPDVLATVSDGFIQFWRKLGQLCADVRKGCGPKVLCG